MKMQLTTSDSQKVIQEKQIETTIKSFPEMRGVTVGVQPPDSAIQQASGLRTQPDLVQPIPTQSGNSRPVRANYPD
ncbi:MAG: hypothetical protein H7Z17_21215 [Fuerstia sp.]|nr:hypothetical protein [Fuerstiella sp.]